MTSTERASDVFRGMDLEDREVASLDPLGLNKLFSTGTFQMLSERGSHGLAILIRVTLDGITVEWLRCLTATELLAVQRDLSHMANVLNRYQCSVDKVLELKELLLECSRLTGEPPSGSFQFYSVRSPVGPSMRTFTRSPWEVVFINSLIHGQRAVYATIPFLVELQSLSIFDPSFAEVAKLATNAFEPMVTAMEGSMRIPHWYFSPVLKPYFNDLVIDGYRYPAGGAAQMLVSKIDAHLGVRSLHGGTPREHVEMHTKHLPAARRDHLLSLLPERDIITSVAVELTSRGVSTTAASSLKALEGFVHVLLKFRGKHYAYAKESFQARESGAVGSGGYNPKDLLSILRNTTPLRTWLFSALARLEA